MTTPTRGLLFHFTHIDNLASIIANGLYSDSSIRSSHALQVEVGLDRIKAARRERVVPIEPGGVVADYVPFYFAARSPMLFTITGGNVETYSEGQDPLVYVVTDCQRLVAEGCRCVFTDRNAYWAYAAYSGEIDRLDELVDWQLMEARIWRNTASEPDRMERRMAELLVHEHVPFAAIMGLAVRTEAMATRVESLLEGLDTPQPVRVRPQWYF